MIEHLVDTHFADTYAARTADVHEPHGERARPMEEAVGVHGDEVDLGPQKRRTESESREARDGVAEMKSLANSSMSSQTGRKTLTRQDSAQWSDAMFDITDDDDDEPDQNAEHSRQQPRLVVPGHNDASGPLSKGTSDAEIADFLTASPAAEKGGVHIEQSSSSAADAAGAKDAPQILHGYSTTVGLGKSMEEQMNTLAKATSWESEDQPTGASEGISRLRGGEEGGGHDSSVD